MPIQCPDNTKDRVPRTRNARNDNGVRDLQNPENQTEVADRAAEKITQMKEIDRSVVIVTNNNAFVAVKLAASTKNVSNDLENKISDRVKSTDKDVDRVYVSANPDFYEHITSYGDDLRNGRPVKGFFNEFSQMIKRVFPDVK